MNTDVNTSAGSNQSVAATTLAQNAFQGDLMAHAKALPDTWQQAFADTHTQDILHSLDHYLTDQLARQADSWETPRDGADNGRHARWRERYDPRDGPAGWYE